MPGALRSLYLDKLPVHVEEKTNTVLFTTFFARSRVENPPTSTPGSQAHAQTRRGSVDVTLQLTVNTINRNISIFHWPRWPMMNNINDLYQQPAQDITSSDKMSSQVPNTLRFCLRELQPARTRLKINRLASCSLLCRSLTVSIILLNIFNSDDLGPSRRTCIGI